MFFSGKSFKSFSFTRLHYMNAKLLAGVLVFLVASVCATGCLGTSAETAPYELIGTWADAGNVFGVSYDLTLVCNDDGTSQLSGYVSYNGNQYDLNEDMTWEYVSGNTYFISSTGRSVSVSLSGDTITMTINPKTLGVADFDINYDLQMARAATSPTAIVGTWEAAESGVYTVNMVYRSDGTGTVSGTIYYNSQAIPFTQAVTWVHAGSNNYEATYGSFTMPLDLYGSMLFATFVPSSFGALGYDDPVSVLAQKV